MHPRALTIVATLFLISGVLALVGVATDLLFRHHVNIDLNVLNLWIGRWLWARDPRGRRWALVMIQLSLVLLPLAGVFFWLTTTAAELRVFGVLVAHSSRVLVSAFVAAVWALQVWEHRVLNRSDVRALFRDGPGAFVQRSA